MSSSGTQMQTKWIVQVTHLSCWSQGMIRFISSLTDFSMSSSVSWSARTSGGRMVLAPVLQTKLQTYTESVSSKLSHNHITAQVRASKGIFWSSLLWEREQRWDDLTSSWTSPKRLHQNSQGVVRRIVWFLCKELLSHIEMKLLVQLVIAVPCTNRWSVMLVIN